MCAHQARRRVGSWLTRVPCACEPNTDKKGKGKKGKKAQAVEEVEAKHFEVSREEEMPEGTAGGRFRGRGGVV